MAEQNLKNLLVFVPTANVDDFKTSHTGTTNGVPTDDYYNKVTFLEDGLISTHGKLFGLTNSDIQKIGLSALPQGQTSLATYVNSLASSFDTLNGTLSGSVQSYVASAVASLVNNAPEALDTLGEIAQLLQGQEGLSSFTELQAQVGGRPMVHNAQGTQVPYNDTLYQYVAYYFNYAKTGFAYEDTEVAGQYISEIDEEDGVIKVRRTSLPTTSDTAVATQYVSAVSQANGKITVTRANLPTLSVDSVAGAAGQYVSGLTVNDHKITATYTSLPSVTYNAETGKYISALTQTNGEVSVSFTNLPTLSVDSTAGAAKQYISALSVSDHKITATYTTLPTISIGSTSANYLTANDHEIGALISTISGNTGITYTTSSGLTTYTTGTETIGTGLITASNVYNRIHATEEYVASALTTLDTRIKTVVDNTTDALDSEITITDTNSYVSATIKQENGVLVSTGSSLTFDVAKIYDQLDSSVTLNATENNVTYGTAIINITDGKLNSASSSFSINRTNILAESSATTTSGASTDPIQVSVTEVNHKVTAVSVTFNDLSTLWETYTPAQ